MSTGLTSMDGSRVSEASAVALDSRTGRSSTGALTLRTIIRPLEALSYCAALAARREADMPASALAGLGAAGLDGLAGLAGLAGVAGLDGLDGLAGSESEPPAASAPRERGANGKDSCGSGSSAGTVSVQVATPMAR